MAAFDKAFFNPAATAGPHICAFLPQTENRREQRAKHRGARNSTRSSSIIIIFDAFDYTRPVATGVPASIRNLLDWNTSMSSAPHQKMVVRILLGSNCGSDSAAERQLGLHSGGLPTRRWRHRLSGKRAPGVPTSTTRTSVIFENL